MSGTFRALIAAAVLGISPMRTIFAAEQTAEIRQVQLMPDIPSPCIIRDWKQVAISQDKLLFAQGQRHAANHSRHARPANHAQDNHDHSIDLRGTHARRERVAQ